MFGTIRRHSKVMWIIIIIVVVISFVVYFNPSTRYDQGGREVELGTIAGEKVTPESYFAAQREVMLMYFTRNGEWPDPEAKKNGFDLEQETWYRLLLLSQIQQNQIHVASPVVAKLAHNILQGFERRIGSSSLVEFERKVLNPQNLSALDFERFIRNEVALQELIALVGGAGRLVTPAEAKEAYMRQHEEVSVQAVSFLATNHVAEVTVTPQAVEQFFTNQTTRYRLPERVQVSYVAFSLSNHLTAAEEELTKTNLAEIIEANYQRLGSNYFSDARSPEEAKATIRTNLIRQQALMLAYRQAKDFANTLFAKEPVKAANLGEVAQTKGLTVQVTEPFTSDNGPKGFEVGPNFMQAAFKLTEEEPLSLPIPGGDAVYMLAFNRRLPSEVPAFDSVREQVTADYKHEQAVMLARVAGRNFIGTLTNGLAQGKSFTEVCTAAKFKPVLLPPFSQATRSLPEIEDQVSLAQLKRVAFDTPAGQTSSFIYARDGGMILHVVSRLPLDEAKMKTELPEFADYLRQMRQNEAFNEWFRKQAEEGLRNTLFARRQQAEMQQNATPAQKPK